MFIQTYLLHSDRYYDNVYSCIKADVITRRPYLQTNRRITEVLKQLRSCIQWSITFSCVTNFACRLQVVILFLDLRTSLCLNFILQKRPNRSSCYKSISLLIRAIPLTAYWQRRQQCISDSLQRQTKNLEKELGSAC